MLVIVLYKEDMGLSFKSAKNSGRSCSRACASLMFKAVVFSGVQVTSYWMNLGNEVRIDRKITPTKA
jgi:hypothetical protein